MRPRDGDRNRCASPDEPEFYGTARAIGPYLDEQIRQGLDRVGSGQPYVAERLTHAQTREALNKLYDLAADAWQEGSRTCQSR